MVGGIPQTWVEKLETSPARHYHQFLTFIPSSPFPIFAISNSKALSFPQISSNSFPRFTSLFELERHDGESGGEFQLASRLRRHRKHPCPRRRLALSRTRFRLVPRRPRRLDWPQVRRFLPFFVKLLYVMECHFDWLTVLVRANGFVILDVNFDSFKFFSTFPIENCDLWCYLYVLESTNRLGYGFTSAWHGGKLHRGYGLCGNLISNSKLIGMSGEYPNVIKWLPMWDCISLTVSISVIMSNYKVSLKACARCVYSCNDAKLSSAMCVRLSISLHPLIDLQLNWLWTTIVTCEPFSRSNLWPHKHVFMPCSQCGFWRLIWEFGRN